MIICRVVGHVWATKKEPGLEGLKLMLVKEEGRAPVHVAADVVGAGMLIYATHTGTPSDSGDVQNILEYVDSLYEQLEGHEAELKRMRGLLLCACCGAENEGDWVYCRSCGQPLERT